MYKLNIVFVLFVYSFTFTQIYSDNVVILSEGNWTNVLEGQWMIEFYAPWCPACQNLQPIWDEFALESEDLNTQVAKVDITKNPALTGIFFVTSLPTIYHCIDGHIRHFDGNRMLSDFSSYVSTKKYLETEPVSWYISPASWHMQLFGSFIRFCVLIRDFHLWLVEYHGIPSWISYVVMGGITLLSGIIMGLILICCCDMLCPPRPQAAKLFGNTGPPKTHPVNFDKDTDEDVLFNNDDDLLNGNNSRGDEVREKESTEMEDDNSKLRQRKT